MPVGLSLLLGCYTHKLDSKGRMVLPARFRDVLGESVVATIIIEPCVTIFSQLQWEIFYARLMEMPVDTDNRRRLRRSILADAHEIEIDGMGRILVPQKLREKADIGQEVNVIGVGDKLEIWNKAAWEKYEVTSVEERREMAEGFAGL